MDAFVTKLTPAGNALSYSTYLGGSDSDTAYGIALDGAGSVYVTGLTSSTNYPTQSAYQVTLKGSQDAFVTKLTPAGNALVYSTYLGGSGVDYGDAIAVDGAGSAYVAGSTQSADFPSQSPYQVDLKGSRDAFVTKLVPAGSALVYSTYLGGSGEDWGSGIAVDGAGSAYVMGNTTSTDFPTRSPYQATYQGGSTDTFVTKLAPPGNALVYSTYLGGNGDDWVMNGLVVDGAGSAYVSGQTKSINFPTQSPYQATNHGSLDSFVTKLGPPTTRVGAYGSGLWRLDANGNGVFDPGVDASFTWGSAGTTPVHGDWNGDGRQKAGFYNNGLWYLDYDGNGVWDNGVADKVYGFGMAGAQPVVGDWNGDGRDEIGIYINGFWFLDMNGNGVWDGTSVDKQIIWGWSGVTPVTGDWNGNGKKKVGLFYNGLWYLDYDGNGIWDGGTTDKVYGFGMSGVQPMVGDWNGDGKDKIGIYIGGFWFLDMNGNGVWDGEATDRMTILGWTGTTPVVGDWNGDGKTKVGTFLNGYWYLDYNGNGVWDGESTDKAYVFGQAGDTPIVGRW
jgi:hypothetical protein